MSLYSAALSDVCRYLGLAFMGTAGASEAKTVDLQAAVESTIQVVLSGFSGATLVHDVGFLDCADIGSLEMLVMNDEIVAMVRRILRGVEVSPDTLMLDLIDQVGPGGEFVSAKETARRCRREIWMPTLFDRQPWDEWAATGAPTVTDRIKARVQEILHNHEPPPLPDGAAEKIRAILSSAEARERS
jgi:trimethylamine--corrinoid protein Co-methyltransferase